MFQANFIFRVRTSTTRSTVKRRAYTLNTEFAVGALCDEANMWVEQSEAHTCTVWTDGVVPALRHNGAYRRLVVLMCDR